MGLLDGLGEIGILNLNTDKSVPTKSWSYGIDAENKAPADLRELGRTTEHYVVNTFLTFGKECYFILQLSPPH
jgi:hypothetical protein